MKRMSIAVVAAMFVGSFGAATPRGNADDKTGSIKGRVTVTGVRDKQNVLVYVVNVGVDYPGSKKPAEMDQEKLTFVPHVLPIVKGTTVTFKNSDSVLHNVFWSRTRDGSYAARNLGSWGKGGTKEFTFDKEGDVTLLCNVHPEMEAHIVVLQNPFFALVGEDGSYEIKGVPPGQYTVKAWYPNPRKLKSQTAELTVSAGKAADLDFSLAR